MSHRHVLVPRHGAGHPVYRLDARISPDLSSYLFGSILAVTRAEIALMVILTLGGCAGLHLVLPALESIPV